MDFPISNTARDFVTATEAIAASKWPLPEIAGQGIAGYEEMVRLLREQLLGVLPGFKDKPRIADALLGLQLRITHLELTGVPMEFAQLFRKVPQEQEGQEGPPGIPSLQPEQ